MAQTLTFACVRTDRTESLFTGSIKPDGVDLAPLALPLPDIFARALNRAEFDVTELSASSYLVQLSRGACDYVALPIFLSRAFRFDSIYVRTDGTITSPKDLIGRRMGTPEFQMTASVWARGLLFDRFGVDPKSITHVTGGLNVPGRRERIKVDPPGFTVEPAGDDKTLDSLLMEKSIDAIMAPEPPASLSDGSNRTRRLFENVRETEAGLFESSGIFPIMHLVAVRRSILDARPELARLLFDAFVAARDEGYRRLEAMTRATALPLMLPFLGADVRDVKQILGADFWPYGVTKNRTALEALCRYSFDQGLSARKMTVAELFVESLLDT